MKKIEEISLEPKAKKDNPSFKWKFIAFISSSIVIGVLSGEVIDENLLIFSLVWVGVAIAIFPNRRSDNLLGGWPTLILSEEKIQVRHGDALLWSKSIELVSEVELEQQVGVFKSLLLKCSDGDSYLQSLPLGGMQAMDDFALVTKIERYARNARRNS